MTSDRSVRDLVAKSAVVTFVIAVTASLIANWLSGRLTDPKANPWATAAVFAMALAIASCCVGYLLSRELVRLRGMVRSPQISGMAPSVPACALAEVLSEVRDELCFMGIVAKRSISDDLFKEFLRRHAGSHLRLRMLLLDPNSQVFADRANEEKESAEGWRQDLTSTVERLRHYKELFSLDIQVRLYALYPVWRLIIIDHHKVIANCFLEGRRGTESHQLCMQDNGSETQFAHSFVRVFELIWKYHSTSITL
jgi:hypothetical protein